MPVIVIEVVELPWDRRVHNTHSTQTINESEANKIAATYTIIADSVSTRLMMEESNSKTQMLGAIASPHYLTR
jgi:hypothetical protein